MGPVWADRTLELIEPPVARWPRGHGYEPAGGLEAGREGLGPWGRVGDRERRFVETRGAARLSVG